jgi:hypothetical protein
MKSDVRVRRIMDRFSGRLGEKLAAKVGRGRLLDIASLIADYESEAALSNTPPEVRRLVDKIRRVPAEFGLSLDALRLSKVSTVEVNAALWHTLQNVFPAYDIQPSEFVPSAD